MYQTRESGKSSRFEAPEPKIPGFLGMGKCVSLSSVLKGTHGSFYLFYSEIRLLIFLVLYYLVLCYFVYLLKYVLE